jgi:hypothetical protein
MGMQILLVLVGFAFVAEGVQCGAKMEFPEVKTGDSKAIFPAEFSGKMNVPKQAAAPTHGVTAFWPAIGGWSGLLQPCLIYSGSPHWKMLSEYSGKKENGEGCQAGCFDKQNRQRPCFKNNPHFCSGAGGEVSVSEGDTISWYLRTVATAGSQLNTTAQPSVQYEFGWTSDKGASDYLKGARTGRPGSVLWAPNVERQWGSVDHKNPNFYPRSPLYLWDLVIKDQHGKEIVPKWSCQQDQNGAVVLDCNWSEGGRKGIKLTFPSGSSYEEYV